jgi:HK97 family phage major capsid protein
MKELLDKKAERLERANEMKTLFDNANTLKRSLDETEQTRWNELDNQIKQLDTEISMLERQVEINKSLYNTGTEMNTNKEEQNMVKQYDLARAIKLTRMGKGLDGVEAEIQAEEVKKYKRMGEEVSGILLPSSMLKRANEGTLTQGANHISTIATDVDIIADRGILAKLGVTIYDGLSNEIKLNFSNGFSSAFVSEESAASQSVPTFGSDTLSARRMQGWQKYTAEYLAESAVMPSLVADMTASLETGYAKALLDAIVANTTVIHPSYSGTTTAVTFQDILKLKGAVKSGQFMSPRFVAGGELYAKLEGTTKDTGSGRFIIENGKINEYGIVDAQGLMTVHDTNKYDLVFGDFKRAYVGYYSGIQLLVDPFTASDNGYVKLTWVRLGDVSFNPSAFKAIKNAAV